MKKVFNTGLKIFILVILIAGCEIKYKPTRLAGIVYNTQTGVMQIEGSVVVPTLVGEFEFSTTYPEDFSDIGDFILIIRDRKFKVDKVYVINRVREDEKIDIFVSGKARIQFENDGAIVEILEGDAVVIDLRSISQKDISWANAPFLYRPFKITKLTKLFADKYLEHPGFVLFCPSWVVGAILYVLVITAAILDSILYVVVGLGLLLSPIGLRNVYYVVLVLGLIIYVIKKTFFN